MTTAARFRFLSFGLASSRFTWAKDSLPLMASTECPKAIRIPNMPRVLEKFVPFRKPSASSLKCRFECEGVGARFGEARARGLFAYAERAARGKQGAAFHVHRAHREGEEHAREHKPWGTLAHGLLGNASGVKRGRGKVIQPHGGGPPVGDERQHDRGGHDQAYPVRLRRECWRPWCHG